MSKLMGVEQAKLVPIRELKDRLSQVVDAVSQEHSRIVVTRHRRPVAVLLSLEDFSILEETVAVLADDAWIGAIQAGLAGIAIGNVVEFTRLQALHVARGQARL